MALAKDLQHANQSDEEPHTEQLPDEKHSVMSLINSGEQKNDEYLIRTGDWKRVHHSWPLGHFCISQFTRAVYRNCIASVLIGELFCFWPRSMSLGKWGGRKHHSNDHRLRERPLLSRSVLNAHSEVAKVFLCLPDQWQRTGSRGGRGGGRKRSKRALIKQQWIASIKGKEKDF